MKVVVSVDSFKGSTTSIESGNAISEGIKRVYPSAQVVVKPLADGGEGTVDALVNGMEGEKIKVPVTGPLGDIVSAVYGIIPSKKTAIIEMSEAAGLTLVPAIKRNPLYTTTYGVGEIILDALKHGCQNFIIGIGGSATNDGGAGMLQALKFGLLDAHDHPIKLGAIGLKDLSTIKNSDLSGLLNKCNFQIACDVTNPLLGKNGSSAVFGPQKGATSTMVMKLDLLLEKFSKITTTIFPKANPNLPGSGAAGGLGFAFNAFLNGKLTPGIDIILDLVQLEKELVDADLVITGEGKLDYQTSMGKAPIGVAKKAKKYSKKVLAFAGCVTSDAKECNRQGIDAFFPILKGPVTLERAMNITNTKKNLSDSVEQVMLLWKLREGD